MSITTLPDVAEFGGTKADEYAQVDASKQLAAASYNALTSRVVAAFNAIGLDSGATSGSLRQSAIDHESRLDTLESNVGVRRTITGDATLDGTEGVVIIDAIGGVNVTLDAGFAGRRVRFLRIGDGTLHALALIRDGGTGTINGAASSYAIYGTTTGGVAIDVWATDTHEWWADTSLYEAVTPLVTTTIPALTTRVTALEAPTVTDENSASVAWETQKRIRHTYTSGVTTYTLSGDTTEWPVGESRMISQYSASTAGFQFAVPSGHKLNTVTNGVSGVLAAAAADDGTALASFLVTREASSEWSWA